MHKPNFNFTRIVNIIAIALVLCFVFSQIFTNTAQAAIGINRQINFQGKLVNNPLSTNVSDTSYTVIFTLYDDPDAGQGTVLWTETQSVTTVDGIFRVALGSVTPFPANFNFNWDGLYLGIKVNADSEMTPRIQMAAVPFAFNAEKVAGLTVQDTSGNASTSGTLQIANTKTVSFADAFSTTNALSFGAGTTGAITLGTGTNTLQLQTTNNTNITLPTTGTLLTNTAAANQTITSTQTTGNILSLADSTGLSGAITGLTIGLTSSTNSQNKTGISFDLSGGTGGVYYDLQGTGSTWSITRAGVLSVASCSGCGGSNGTNWWNQLAGALSPLDTTNDFLLGSTATTSALFSYTGVKTGQTIASASGSLIVMPNNGYGGNASFSGALTLGAFSNGAIQTTSNSLLTLGGATTGNITLSPNNGTAGLVSITGSSLFTTGTGLTTIGGSLTVNGTAITLASATIIDSSGAINLGTTNATTLTLGRSTQGITLPGFTAQNGVLYGTQTTGVLAQATTASTGLCLVSGASNPGWSTCPGGSGGGAFTELEGAIVPLNSTEDFLVGGQATSSAKFSITGLSNLSNQVNASLSGQFIVMANNGWGGNATISGALTLGAFSNGVIQTTNNQLLTIGGNTTGDIQFKPGTGMVFIGDNEVKSGGLTFYSSGVGETDASIITDATGNLIFSAPTGTVEVGSGTGNISLEGDADTSIVASFIGIPAADMFQITNTGQAITASGVDGLALAYVLGGSLAVTNAGITVDLTTTNNNASTVLRGINIGNITGQASATEVGLRVGTGWDSGITVESGGITVDNAAAAISIFTAKDNGTAVFTIADGGDITWAAATPTITINAAETFTISNGTAADNFVYNTSTNALTLGDGTNGLTFDIDTGMLYQGSGRLTKRITLTPEYAGGAIMADGAANTGAMTSDNTNAAGTKFRNFYKWANTQGTVQDYDIWISVPIPNDFSAMAATPTLSIDTYSSDLTNGTVLVTVYDSQATPVADCTDVAFTPTGVINTWETKTATTCLDTGTYTAGGVMTIKIHLTAAATTGVTQVSTVTFDYLSKF